MIPQRTCGLEQGSENSFEKQKDVRNISDFAYCATCLNNSPVPLELSTADMVLELESHEISAYYECF